MVAEGDLVHEGILQEIELLLGLHDLEGREDVELRNHGVDGIGVEDYVEVKNELVHLLLIGGGEGLEAVERQRTQVGQGERVERKRDAVESGSD